MILLNSQRVKPTARVQRLLQVIMLTRSRKCLETNVSRYASPDVHNLDTSDSPGQRPLTIKVKPLPMYTAPVILNFAVIVLAKG